MVIDIVVVGIVEEGIRVAAASGSHTARSSSNNTSNIVVVVVVIEVGSRVLIGAVTLLTLQVHSKW